MFVFPSAPAYLTNLYSKTEIHSKMTIMVGSKCGAPNLILRIRLEWLFKVGYINVCIWGFPLPRIGFLGSFYPKDYFWEIFLRQLFNMVEKVFTEMLIKPTTCDVLANLVVLYKGKAEYCSTLSYEHFNFTFAVSS